MDQSNSHHAVSRYLLRTGMRLSTAESCTAGLIASKVAEVPGCGSVLRCAVVAYAPEIKTRLLGVRQDLIDRAGLTSEPVALAMARGVLAMTGADLAISNTGVADDGAPDGTPPGTQCFAWIFRRPGARDLQCMTAEFTETARFDGSRNEIRNAAADWALMRIPSLHALARRHS